MGDALTFQQILEEKMGLSPRETVTETAFTEEHVIDPLENIIASLLSSAVNFKVRIPRGKYPAGPRSTPKPRPRKNEITILVSSLSPEGRQALERFIQLGAEEWRTIEILSESIVQKAFRRLAMRHHPDQNPRATGREFQSLRQARQVLLQSLRA